MSASLTTTETQSGASKSPEAHALPIVSVIIPVRNDAQRLAVCLASLRQQDYSADRCEVIVVDNGSSDESRDVARAYGARVLYYPNLRVGALRNRGVEQAQGEILAFVDSDHEVPTEWIRSGVQQLAADSGRAIIGSPCLAPANGTWVQRGWELHRLRDRQRRETTWLGTGNMFLRRADFDRLGGFREDLVAAEDVDLCVRFAAQSGRVISDMRVANVHHGEPRTLWQFFWKEYWRGSSGIRAFIAHGMPLHELPSLVWPLYHLLAGIALVAALVYGIWVGSLLVPFTALVLFVAPALLLSVKTCWQVRRAASIPALAVLYLTYGLCRAAALFKR
ncbi:MAG TPA: glycosyltransferase [Pirellulaceae bacterium]|nr:glycosyltransferase [Pirellulaceae bacterium]